MPARSLLVFDLVRQVLGQQRQRRSHILIVHQNVRRNIQMLRRKIPDRADAALDQQVAHMLRVLCRDGDDADLHLVAAADLVQTGHVHDRLAAFAHADDGVVCVERRHDVQPVLGKAAVAEQRAAELARADEDGLVRVAVAQKALNIRDQTFAVIADLRPTLFVYEVLLSFL